MNYVDLRSRRRRLVWLAGVLFFCFTFLICPTPVQADTSYVINPQLETDVLQIIRNHPEVIKEALKAEEQRQEQQQQKALQDFKQEIKENPFTVIGESPVMGAKEKKIVLIEFSDFQCPYCGKVQQTLNQLMLAHQNEVTLVYKHYPLSGIHPQAIPAAKAAIAAGKQGKFWQYHDALFNNQDKLSEELYVAIAKYLNLDLTKFNQQRNEEEVSELIEKDQLLAEKLGISGTPFFFMNGETFSGAVPLSKIESLLAGIKANLQVN
ncbi:MAG TPA: thioredoxin domain-containing protein [Nodularia sp. (in: cyanobacteria)]|nr:thioredoxin domain-containing protein [Nodularia sp. (in: cyanobacteria)]